MTSPADREFFRTHLQGVLVLTGSSQTERLARIGLTVLSELELAEERLRLHGEAVIDGLRAAGEAS